MILDKGCYMQEVANGLFYYDQNQVQMVLAWWSDRWNKEEKKLPTVKLTMVAVHDNFAFSYMLFWFSDLTHIVECQWLMFLKSSLYHWHQRSTEVGPFDQSILCLAGDGGMQSTGFLHGHSSLLHKLCFNYLGKEQWQSRLYAFHLSIWCHHWIHLVRGIIAIASLPPGI